jgi:hypothetical protein
MSNPNKTGLSPLALDAEQEHNGKAILGGAQGKSGEVMVRHTRPIRLSWKRSGTQRKQNWPAKASRTSSINCERRRTLPRFAALPRHVQELTVEKLRDWAEKTSGSLESPYSGATQLGNERF